MKKKKSLLKYIKRELADLNTFLKHIEEKDVGLGEFKKQICMKRTREEYFNTCIKPLMYIYQASKKNICRKKRIL